MTFPVSSTNSTKVSGGTCPHGLPHGACPICSGMGGGGGGIKNDSKPKTHEMSYDECYAIWMQMKSEQLAKTQRNKAFDAAFAAKPVAIELSAKIANVAQKITEFADKINSEHPILAKPITFAAKKIIVPLLNIAKNITSVIKNAAEFVKQKITDISDKLSAVFGEIKNFTLKKLSDKFHDFRKKISSFFGFIYPEKTSDEENKLETEKKIFNVKTLFQKIQKNLINKKEVKTYGRN